MRCFGTFWASSILNVPAFKLDLVFFFKFAFHRKSATLRVATGGRGHSRCCAGLGLLWKDDLLTSTNQTIWLCFLLSPLLKFLQWPNGKFQVVLGLKYQCHAIMSSCIEDFAEVLQLLCIEVPAGCCVELGLHLQAPQYQATCAACRTSQVHYEKSLGMHASKSRKWSWQVQCLFDWISFLIIINTLVMCYLLLVYSSICSFPRAQSCRMCFFLLLLI